MSSLFTRLVRAVTQNPFLYGVLAISILLQIALVARPFDFILTNLLPDDAFYYYQIARHIVLGDGSTFDGVNPTNGYHPLWMLVLLPIFKLWSVGGVVDTAPIYVSLFLSIAFNTVTSLAVIRILTRITSLRSVQVAVFSLWALNPFVLFESLNGLETSLALMTFALFTLAALRASEQDTQRSYIIVGILGGLMVLARIDMVFYLAAFYLWLLARYGIRGGFARAIPAGLISTAVIVPWFIWNYVFFGMLLTSASSGNELVNHTLIVQDHGSSFAQFVKATIYLIIHYGTDVVNRTGAPWLLFGAVGAVLALVGQKSVGLPRKLRDTHVLLALFLGFVALFLVNAGVRFTGRTWYFISFNVFFVLLLALVLDRTLSTMRHRVVVLVCLVLITLGSFFIGWYSSLRDSFILQRAMFTTAEWMNEQLPPGTPVGVFNAGVQAYFTHARVINLDGLVNNSAHEAMREKRLWSYINEEGIEYINDYDLYMTYRYKSFLDTPDIFKELTLVTQFSSDASQADLPPLRVYQVGVQDPE